MLGKHIMSARWNWRTLRDSVRLNRTGNRAAIISHLHERGFLMNNSIDLLFRWRISLGMYLTFLRRESKPERSVTAHERSPFRDLILHHRGIIRSNVPQQSFLQQYRAFCKCAHVHCYTHIRTGTHIHTHRQLDRSRYTITTALFIVIAELQSVSVSINKK